VTTAGPDAPATRRRAWIAWAAVCIIWGTTYLAIKIGLDTIPPFLMGGLRYIASGVILGGVLRAQGHPLPGREDWGRLAILGFFMLMLGNGGVVWGEQYLSSGLTAVLIGTTPFWMVSVDAMFPGGRSMHARQWIGLAVGFVGIVLLVWPDIAGGGAMGQGMTLGVIAIQIACAGWALGSAYTRRHVMPGDLLGSAALQMLFGGVIMVVAGTLAGEWAHLSFNLRTSLAIAYLTVFGGVIAFSAFSYALGHLDIAIVSLYSYINPVIAVILGVLVLGERFELRMLVAAAIIVVGILVVRKEPVKSRSPA
jgi:drug/metabolite transporter (DMT)-like permease